MKIALTVGHSRLKNGSYTSADGTRYGGCNEYKWCKAFSRQVASTLRKRGHKVARIVCPERKLTSHTQEKDYKLRIINNGDFDLVIEFHLNASIPQAEGTEVLYKSNKGLKYARKVQKELSKVFEDRGVNHRDDLYILNQTDPTAILIETFFCTNKHDYKLAKGITKRKKLARLVADGIEKAI